MNAERDELIELALANLTSIVMRKNHPDGLAAAPPTPEFEDGEGA
jgi:hypothetical protein